MIPSSWLSKATLSEGLGVGFPLGFFSLSLWMSAALYQLVFSIVAAIAGAAPYSGKEAAH